MLLTGFEMNKLNIKKWEGIRKVNVTTRKGQDINSIMKNESIISDDGIMKHKSISGASQMVKHFDKHFCIIPKTILKNSPFQNNF